MSQSWVITNVLTVPANSDLAKPAASMYASAQVVNLGLELDGRQVVWGVCRQSHLPEARPTRPFDVATCLDTLHGRVAPLLLGQPAFAYRELLGKVDELSVSITVSHSRAVTVAPEDQRRQARRRLLTGQFTQPSRDTAVRREVDTWQEEHPIHAGTRHGVSEALTAAAALAAGRTVVGFLARAERTAAPPRILMQSEWDQSIRLFPHVAAVAYDAKQEHAGASLGREGELLQRSVRRLKEQLVAALGETGIPTIHISFAGSLGDLVGNDAGRLLGALHGLAHAASPCLLQVEDPVLLPDQVAQIRRLRELRDMARFRKLAVHLAAGAWVTDPDAVRAFAAAGAVDLLRLDACALGGPDRLMDASAICHETEMPFLLAGASAESTAELALAASPNLVASPADMPGDPGVLALQQAMDRSAVAQAVEERMSG